MKLYTYFRSSAAYRVRIALALKGLTYDAVRVHLMKGEQYGAEYSAINPQNLVPVLEDEGQRVYQSLAILQYIDETWPQPPLQPADRFGRARVRSLALLIACEIHPLNNPRVLNYLTGKLGVSEEQKLEWYHHWIKTGFSALEKRLAGESQTGRYCHGEVPGLADCALVPQMANALRFKVDLAEFPAIRRINAACLELEAFQKAAPENQPDAE
ncbi:MAG TPA: maleylacetoacetate isomerase [Burkholderiales bacterium]|jgi:maleylacetoacetate isomerase